MQKELSIVWFRQDLRTSDNPALDSAARLGEILPIYIFDDCAPKLYQIGSVSKVWLHHSLTKLNKSLDNKLNFYTGNASDIISKLLKKHKITKIFWNKCFEPWHLQQEKAVKDVCEQNDAKWKIFNSNYLWSPNEILKDDSSYYKVFTAYKNKARTISARTCSGKTPDLSCVKDSSNKTKLADLALIPDHKWYQKIEKLWDVGEDAAHHKVDLFIEKHLSGYKEGRNFPALEQTSMLSPHLHFGEITPAQILDSISSFGEVNASDTDKEHFLNELIWREFSVYLLHHFNTLHKDNFNSKFNNFAWKNSTAMFNAWRHGHTGYPFVDAGMRQLWQTGYMHNRVRMVVASFLVKNLGIHWHKGRDWFWDCLVDADLANNSASWQWVAGCGVDAAPYFRIFNPTTQGQKFDVKGEYIRQFVPELKNLPDKYLFEPWKAPADVLKSAGVILGKTYPMPIVDLVETREKALEMYKQL